MMRPIDQRATIQPNDGFQQVRAPGSNKLVCEFNPATNEIRVVKRNGSTLIAVLPIEPKNR